MASGIQRLAELGITDGQADNAGTAINIKYEKDIEEARQNGAASVLHSKDLTDLKQNKDMAKLVTLLRTVGIPVAR